MYLKGKKISNKKSGEIHDFPPKFAQISQHSLSMEVSSKDWLQKFPHHPKFGSNVFGIWMLFHTHAFPQQGKARMIIQHL